MKNIIIKLIKLSAILFLLSFFIIQSLIILTSNQKIDKDIDYVVILGARLYKDIPSPSLLERLKTSLIYLNKNKDTKVVVTGGQGVDEDIEEALAMKKYLVENNIDENRIIVEGKSTSTYENLKFALEKIEEIDKREDLNILIVSNRYHLFRAKFLLKRLGHNPYGLASKTPITIIFKSYVREYFAVIKSLILDKW